MYIVTNRHDENIDPEAAKTENYFELNKAFMEASLLAYETNTNVVIGESDEDGHFHPVAEITWYV